LRRNYLLRQVIEGKIKGGIEVTVRRGRRRRKLLDDLKERRGYSRLKEEALDRTMWRARFGRLLNECMNFFTCSIDQCLKRMYIIFRFSEGTPLRKITSKKCMIKQSQDAEVSYILYRRFPQHFTDISN
jgi:hypothetical protein